LPLFVDPAAEKRAKRNAKTVADLCDLRRSKTR